MKLKNIEKTNHFAKAQPNRQIIDMEIRRAIKEKQKKIEQLTKENEYQSLLLEKTEQIARQNEELTRVNEELRQFAYIASHDLKEPLRMVASYTQLLERMAGDELDDSHRLYFRYVTEGVHRMNNLLDALLKYATIGKMEEETELVDLNEIVKYCSSNLKVPIEETEAIIQTELLPSVMGNSSLFVQLLQNLIGNALKFKSLEKKPFIQIASRETDDAFIISVNDNGIGIANEHKNRIFEIFQRLHPRTKYEGTGIGLAICHKIIQGLGGRIWVESEVGKGATFYFSIPK